MFDIQHYVLLYALCIEAGDIDGCEPSVWDGMNVFVNRP